jgi:hypothetical protein
VCVWRLVPHEPEVFHLRIDLIDQPAHDLGGVLHRTLRCHLDMPPACSWFDHDEQIARPFAFVLVNHALRLPWLHGNRRVHIGMQDHWLLI